MAIMPCWYFDKKEFRNTPSILDGIDYETELRYRKDGARFIQDTGTKMDLPYNTMATGVVYFHRFYMFHSFRNFPRYVTASCCLFLAGKVEETPKKCRDIIGAAKGSLSEAKFGTFGDDPKVSIVRILEPLKLWSDSTIFDCHSTQNMTNTITVKEEVMTLERILLQTIKFDFQVEHPYYFLLKYAKCLKGDKQKLQKMVQMAWTFVNDSLCTTLCLQWEPEVIAVALMYLAGKLSKFEVVDWTGRTSKHLRWWDMFIEDVTMDLLEDICHQVLDLYSQPQVNPSPDSPPLPPARTVPLPPHESSRSPIATTGAPIPTGMLLLRDTRSLAEVSMIGKTVLVKPPEQKLIGTNGDLPKLMGMDPMKPPPLLVEGPLTSSFAHHAYPPSSFSQAPPPSSSLYAPAYPSQPTTTFPPIGRPPAYYP